MTMHSSYCTMTLCVNLDYLAHQHSKCMHFVRLSACLLMLFNKFKIRCYNKLIILLVAKASAFIGGTLGTRDTMISDFLSLSDIYM